MKIFFEEFCDFISDKDIKILGNVENKGNTFS